jgi:hypothetical protein
MSTFMWNSLTLIVAILAVNTLSMGLLLSYAVHLHYKEIDG